MTEMILKNNGSASEALPKPNQDLENQDLENQDLEKKTLENQDLRNTELGSSKGKQKKTVADIIINRILKDVEENGCMPWQKPYRCYNSFNYFTMNTYRGINRLLLPFGEYITKKQIREYNEKNNEDYTFQKGIKWYPVVYFTTKEVEISLQELEEMFKNVDLSKDGYIGTDGIWSYYIVKGKGVKSRNILKYFEVADRVHFRNSKGELLPSRIEEGKVTLTYEEPSKVIDNYIKRSGVHMVTDHIGIPCYSPKLDTVKLNPHTNTEEEYFSTAFHELAHSTGHFSRLNREGINYPEVLKPSEKEDLYAVEECIAEITASLLCGECGVHEFSTSGTKSYENNLAYINGWKKKIQDWNKKFIYIVSQADKAFYHILEGLDENIER